MNFKRELEKLVPFLNKTQGIWQEEVLNRYPDTIDSYCGEWLHYLSTLDDREQLDFECRRFHNLNLPHSLKEFFLKLSELEEIPHLKDDEHEKSYPSWAFSGVTGKKQHEITNIVHLLKEKKINSEYKILDIGGGVGHLARTLALYHGKNVTSLDKDSELQDKGKIRLHKYPHPKEAGILEFACFEFGRFGNDDKKLDELIKNHQVSLGLHTCGPLAINHFNLTKKNPDLMVINFGCCYQKLEVGKDVPLSQFAKSMDINLTKYALTLASRGNYTITHEEFMLKKRVKLYRAALHFLLQEKYNINHFITLGSSFPRIYREDFHVYVHEKLAKLNLNSASAHELNQFYKSEFMQRKIHQVYYANMLRWHFARILEKFILIDRALWLEEQGVKAEVIQVFSPQLSPRNTAIIANEKDHYEQCFK